MPRLPFIGALPTPPQPPVFVPGKGFMAAEDLVNMLAPALDQQEGIYLASLTELATGLLGLDKADLEDPSWSTVNRLLLSPTEQARELQQALGSIAGSEGNSQAVRSITSDVMQQLMDRLAGRAGVPVDTLFPGVRPLLMQALASGSSSESSSSSSRDGAAAGAAAMQQQTQPDVVVQQEQQQQRPAVVMQSVEEVKQAAMVA